VDREGRFDRGTWEALGPIELLGLGCAEELGGSGGTVGDSLAVVEEIARVLPSLAVDFVLGGMTTRLLTEQDAGAARDLLPALAEGRKIASFGLSEPGAGTDLLNLRTTARGLRVSGYSTARRRGSPLRWRPTSCSCLRAPTNSTLSTARAA